MKRPLRVGAAFALGLAAGAVALAATGAAPAGRSRSTLQAAMGLGTAVVRTGLPTAAAFATVGAGGPAPADLFAELSGGGRELRLSLRRAGHLVALGDGTTRAAGEDWVAVTLDPRTGNAASPPSLVWETTDLASLATTRGVVRLRPGAGAPVPELVSSAPPAIAARHEGKHHRCEAVHDERGGFVVLCLVDAKARRVAAASPVGARALEDVWIGPSRPGRPTLVRLDLPVVRGGAAARLVGYVDGATAVAVRAEASWLFGEPSAKLFLGALSKVQPQVR